MSSWNKSPKMDQHAKTLPGLGSKKVCKHLEEVYHVDYKDCELLRKFITERGKIMPRRITYATAKQQRQIKRAIRRARVMGLLP